MVDETEVRRDVVQVLGTPTNGQVATWDASKGEWVPQSPATPISTEIVFPDDVTFTGSLAGSGIVNLTQLAQWIDANLTP